MSAIDDFFSELLVDFTKKIVFPGLPFCKKPVPSWQMVAGHAVLRQVNRGPPLLASFALKGRLFLSIANRKADKYQPPVLEQ